jgi:two-component system, NtrC family, response regulator AtoC
MKSILVVDDEKLVRWTLRQKLEGAGYGVLEAATFEEGIRLFQENLPELVTLDVRLPDGNGLKLLLELKKLAPATPVVMITAFGAIEDAVRALQIGAYDYLEKPINFERLLNSIRNALEARDMRVQLDQVTREDKKSHCLDQIIGVSDSMQAIKNLIVRIAGTETSTILIQGESGTGKDLVAKALHYESDRNRRPFMVLNCAAIPEQLLESELFGHERGAFTDAKVLKKGLFEQSDGGSFFFDEISEMALNLQAKLLRVLEDQTFRRIGGVKDIHVNVRIICATNSDLEELVRNRKFREDLYYRLSVIPIVLPPLRDRKEDIEPLTAAFISEYNRLFNKSIRGVTDQVRKTFSRYHWPGNVRELKNAIERAMILQDDGHLDVDLFPLRIAEFRREGASLAGIAVPEGGLDLYEVEKDLVRQALAKAKGNQSEAARLLSVTRDTLRYKIKKYDLFKDLPS